MVESEDNKRGRIHRHGDGCELYSSDCTTISIQSAIARFSPGNSVPPLALFDQEASRRGGDRQQKSPLGFSLSLSLSSKILSSLLSQILKSPRAPSRITNNSLFPVSFRPFLQFLSRKKKIKGERKKIRPSCVVGEAFDSYVRMLFFDCFITRLRNCLCSTEAEFPNLVIIFFIDSTFNLTHLLIFLLLFYF